MIRACQKGGYPVRYTDLLSRGEWEIFRAVRLHEVVRATLLSRQRIRGGSSDPLADDLHTAVHAKLDAGTLPLVAPIKMWAGKARGSGLCVACDKPIEQDALEYEPEFADGKMLLFHQKCLGVWHEERVLFVKPPK